MIGSHSSTGGRSAAAGPGVFKSVSTGEQQEIFKNLGVKIQARRGLPGFQQFLQCLLLRLLILIFISFYFFEFHFLIFILKCGNPKPALINFNFWETNQNH